MASMGHVRDLPKSKLGVDVEHDFTPKYIVIPERRSRSSPSSRRRPRKRRTSILAADPDREGEAIGWHLRGARSRRQGSPSRRVPSTRSPSAAVEGGLPSCRADRSEHGQRPAGAAHPRPARRLPDQPAPVEEGRPGPERRPGPVGGGAHHRRAREGDPGLCSRGILDDLRPSRRGAARRRSGPP